MKERNKQMALLTFFTMVLVIIGHSDITDDFHELWISKWIYSFHMPMFFFISGFLFCLTNPLERLSTTPYIMFIKKKAIRLLIPFLFVNTLIFIIKALLIKDVSMMQHPVEFTISDFLYRTFLAPIGFMWFLPALFSLFAMAFPLWKYILKRCYRSSTGLIKIDNRWMNYDLLISIATIICVTMALYEIIPDIQFMRISRAFYHLPYFFFGIMYCVYKEHIDKVLYKYWYIIVSVSGLLSMSLILSERIAAMTGIIFCITGSLLLADKIGYNIVRLSQYSYTIFLLAYFPQMFVRGPVAHHMLVGTNQYLLSVLSFVSGLGLPLIFCEIYTRLSANNRTLTLMGKVLGL